ncbi:hypothetical protein ADUPG1_002547, partial [Aduncisulcus paluster]
KHDSQTSSRISCVVCFEAEHIPYVHSARGIPDIHDSTTVRYGPEQGASCIAYRGAFTYLVPEILCNLCRNLVFWTAALFAGYRCLWRTGSLPHLERGCA